MGLFTGFSILSAVEIVYYALKFILSATKKVRLESSKYEWRRIEVSQTCFIIFGNLIKDKSFSLMEREWQKQEWSQNQLGNGRQCKGGDQLQ